MKKGGLAIAVLIVITGALRWAIPGGAPFLGFPSTESTMKIAAPLSASAGGTQPDTGLHRPYSRQLQDKIQEFFGVDQEDFIELETGKKKIEKDPELRDLFEHWNVPCGQREKIQFVVALLPDPVHTQLNLFFDRGIETIQQAAQIQGYDFDRATMPWDSGQHPESTDFDQREKEAAVKSAREVFPGLMIFRPSANPSEPSASSGPLFVFVVGETATAGVHKNQFANALEIMKEIRAPSSSPSACTDRTVSSPLFILGPTFSGSLYSLNENLKSAVDLVQNIPIYVFSGTLRGTEPRRWFERAAPSNVRFVAFQEGEARVIQKFIEFATDRGYCPDEIAILSEDETAYGSSTPPKDPTSSEGQTCTSSIRQNVARLYFPHGISQFRSAYEKQLGTQSAQSASQGKAVLPRDLEATGSEDDSVPSFAKVQSPLSKEAVMLGIITRLHNAHPKLIVLRASDPVDELFLARYLRQNYPQARVAVTAPDLLLSREDDALLHGVLGLNAYPLDPGMEPYICHPQDRGPVPRAFVSTSDVGSYNAMLALLRIQRSPPDGELLFKKDSHLRGADLPEAPYAYYGDFLDWREPSSGTCMPGPGIWISILGRDGYWMVHHFPTANASEEQDASGLETNIHLVSQSSQPTIESPRTPKSWYFAYFSLLLALVLQVYLVYQGCIFSGSEIRARFGVVESPRRDLKAADSEENRALLAHRWRRATLLAMGNAYVVLIILFLVAVRYALTARRGSLLLNLLFAALPLVSTALLGWDLKKRRGEPRVAWILMGVTTALAVAIFIPYIGPASWITSLTAYRAAHLTSGISPLLPLALLFAAGTCIAWFELQGLAVTDCRRPALPRKADLGAHYRVSEEDVSKFRKLALPLSMPSRIILPLLCLMPLILLTLDFRHPHPVQSVEGAGFDWVYALCLFTTLTVLLGCLSRLVSLWHESRRFLGALDILPLRDAFKRLQDFNWSLIWSTSGSAFRDSYKLVSREIENLSRLKRLIHLRPQAGEVELCKSTIALIDAEIQEVFNLRDGTQKHYAGLLKPSDSQQTEGNESCAVAELVSSYALLQKQLGKMAGLILREVLAVYWAQSLAPVASNLPEEWAPKKTGCQLVAEEYVSLVFGNFLTSALLRMRTLVMETIGIYLFLLLSISLYPFEPNPEMFTLAVVFLLVMGAVIGAVYAQMHRDPALSRLTSTAEGELGIEFWIQFIGAGAIPVLSLLAVQFPAISRIVTGLLQPALQSVK